MNFSLFFIESFYAPTKLLSSPLWCLVPTGSVLITLALSFCFTSLSELIFCCKGLSNTIAHVAVGAMALVFTSLTVYSSDFELVQFVLNFLRPRKKKD